MAVLVTYVCDRCGSKSESREHFWEIALAFSSHPIVPRTSAYEGLHAQWCRPCMEKFRLLPSRKAEDKAPEPSMGEKIESIMREIAGEVAADVVRENARG